MSFRLILAGGLLWVCACSVVQAQDLPVPEGKRLRQIVAEKYPDGNVFIGGTTGWSKLKHGAGKILDREFSYVTPENDFKQVVIHPMPGQWDWSAADAWIKHCRDNGQVVRIHGPVSPQSSRWAKADQRTAAELTKNMDEFLSALCKRYDHHDHVKWIDVVNETVGEKGEWFGPKPGVDKWENPWPKMGYDESDSLRPPVYIQRAFKIANKYAPNTKLIINQHGSMQQPMWGKVKATILYLRKRGLRVDGIGWQAHVDVGWEKKKGNVDHLHELIRWSHANQLSFHITENNVWLKTTKDYQAQATTFGVILRVLLEHRDTGIVTWNVWNLSDGGAWIENRAFDGCLFDAQFKAKPAYYAIQKELHEAAVKEK